MILTNQRKVREVQQADDEAVVTPITEVANGGKKSSVQRLGLQSCYERSSIGTPVFISMLGFLIWVSLISENF